MPAELFSRLGIYHQCQQHAVNLRLAVLFEASIWYLTFAWKKKNLAFFTAVSIQTAQSLSVLLQRWKRSNSYSRIHRIIGSTLPPFLGLFILKAITNPSAGLRTKPPGLSTFWDSIPSPGQLLEQPGMFYPLSHQMPNLLFSMFDT